MNMDKSISLTDRVTSKMLAGMSPGDEVVYRMPSYRAICNTQRMCVYTRDMFPELGIKIFETSVNKEELTIKIKAVGL